MECNTPHTRTTSAAGLAHKQPKNHFIGETKPQNLAPPLPPPMNSNRLPSWPSLKPIREEEDDRIDKTTTRSYGQLFSHCSRNPSYRRVSSTNII
ncbi:hypothetical protein SLA2020_107630 [Shorea laevis]